MKRLFFILGMLLASPAFGQGSEDNRRDTQQCLDLAGKSVPCELSDIWLRPQVTSPGKASQPNDPAQVVTLSPNSGASQPYPAGAVALTETATGTTGGTTATFPALAGKTNWLCGFSVSPGAASSAITITITTTGLTNNFSLSVGAPVAAAGTTASIVTVPITPCVPASAANTAITVVAGSLSTGGVNQAVNAWGFRQ